MTPYRDFIASPGRPVAVIAHRGAWRRAPENSVAGIEAAAQLGCSVAEIDVRRTRDGALVLLHDRTAERTTGHALVPEETGFAELRELALRESDGGDGAPFTLERLPNLEQALEAARERIFLDLDLKDPALAPMVVESVRRLRMEGGCALKFDARTPGDMLGLKRMEEETGIAIMAKIMVRDPAAALAVVETAPPFMVECSFERLDAFAPFAQVLSRRGIGVWLNTLDVSHSLDLNDTRALADPEAVWGALLDIGVDAFQTDEPEALLGFLVRRMARAA